jgi:hypothetical protein
MQQELDVLTTLLDAASFRKRGAKTLQWW